MFDKDKMEAEASDNSLVQQAGRDLTIYQGPKIVEIIEVIDYQIEKRVPELLLVHGTQLIEAENQKVQIEIQEFKQSINSMLESKLDSSSNAGEEAIKILSKVTDANFQYLFHEGLKHVIRRKESSSKELLIELLSKKLDSDEADDNSYIIDDAIETLSNISKNQINFLGFLTAIRNLTINITYQGEIFDCRNLVSMLNQKGLQQEEIKRIQNYSSREYLKSLNTLIEYFLSLYPASVDVDYLASKGLVFVEIKSFTLKSTDLILQNIYGTENFENNEKNLQILVPRLYLLLNRYGVKSVDELPAYTSKGQIIGNIIFNKYLKNPS